MIMAQVFASCKLAKSVLTYSVQSMFNPCAVQSMSAVSQGALNIMCGVEWSRDG